jgi:hypothetical protein
MLSVDFKFIFKSVFLFFSLMVLTFITVKHRPDFFERQDYVAPPIEIKFLSAGFSKQIADGFWVRALQDFDYCEKSESNKSCRSFGWLFQLINLITELDIYFEEAYYYGALSLSIIVSDHRGASSIFDKGTTVFSNKWRLLYAAGYHALYEEKNSKKASALYLRSADNGAPKWVRLLAGNLAVEANQTEAANKILEELIRLESDPKWIDKLRQKMKSFAK